MEKAFNGLSAAEAERLAVLSEELAEIAEACMWRLAYGAGAAGVDPSDPEATVEALAEKECGDLLAVLAYMEAGGDFAGGLAAERKASADEAGWPAALAQASLAAAKLAGKTLRHGWESRNPFEPETGTNREALGAALGAAVGTMRSAAEAGALSFEAMEARSRSKLPKLRKFLHEQSEHPEGSEARGPKA